MIPSLRSVAVATAEYYGLHPSDLYGQCRERRIAWPRQVAMSIMNRSCRASTGAIGRELNRDHTTVIHGIRSVSQRSDPDEKVAIATIVGAVEKHAEMGSFKSSRAVHFKTTRKETSCSN